MDAGCGLDGEGAYLLRADARFFRVFRRPDLYGDLGAVGLEEGGAGTAAVAAGVA